MRLIKLNLQESYFVLASCASYFSSASSEDLGVTVVVKSQVNRDAVVWDNIDSNPIAQPPTQNHMPSALPRYTPVQAHSQSQAKTQSSSQSESTQELPSKSQEPTLKINSPYKRMLVIIDAFCAVLLW